MIPHQASSSIPERLSNTSAAGLLAIIGSPRASGYAAVEILAPDGKLASATMNLKDDRQCLRTTQYRALSPAQ